MKRTRFKVTLLLATVLVLASVAVINHPPAGTPHEASGRTASGSVRTDRSAKPGQHSDATGRGERGATLKRAARTPLPSDEVTAFNVEFRRAAETEDPEQIRLLLKRYYALLADVAGTPTPLQYNAACYLGELIGILNRKGVLTAEESDEFGRFLAGKVHDRSLDDEYRSALLASAIPSGLNDTVCALGKETLESPDLDPDSHLARRAAGVLFRAGHEEERNVALDYARRQARGSAVNAIVGFVAENRYDGAVRDLVELKAAGVSSPLFSTVPGEAAQALVALVTADDSPHTASAMALGVDSFHRDDDKLLLVRGLSDVISDTRRTADSRTAALAELLRMTGNMSIPQGKEALGAVRQTIDSDPLFENQRAHIKSICDSEMTP